MSILRFVIAILFQVMAVGLVSTYIRVRRRGLLLGAAAYAAGGLGAVIARAWWPLGAGFAVAFVLSRLGAELPVDVRFDLPDIDRTDTTKEAKVRDYLTRWIVSDPQVGFLRSQLVQEMWSSGCRGTVSLRSDVQSQEESAEAAWRQSTTTDLRQLARASRAEFIKQLDAMDALGRATIVEAGDRAAKYEVPDTPRDLNQIASLIPSPEERQVFLENYMANCLVSARLRVLAWAYQSWHGERYMIPEDRDGPPTS